MFWVPGLENDFSINSLLNLALITNVRGAQYYALAEGLNVMIKWKLVSILAVTKINQPNYVGSAYTPTKSFGFSPNSSVGILKKMVGTAN